MGNILTSKMATAANKNAGSACKLFFPFNDGAGSTPTDTITGLSYTISSPTYNVPHATTGLAASVTPVGTLPVLPDGKSLIMLDSCLVHTSAINAYDLLGTTTGSSNGIELTDGFKIHKANQTTTSAAFATIADTNKVVRLGTFNGVSGLVSSYSCINGATPTADNTADGSAHTGGITFSPLMTTGLSAQDWYGLALYIVDALPSDATILAAIAEVYENWTNGNKVLPSGFAGLV